METIADGPWTLFYQCGRYAFGGVSALVLIIFTAEVWRDRAGIKRLFTKRPRSSFVTYRILRICGMVASLLLTALSVDFYGAYGIYPRVVRVSLYSIITAMFSFTLGFGIYDELVQTLVVLNLRIPQKKSKTITASLVTIHLSVNYALYAVSSFVMNRTLFLVARAFQAYVFVAVIVVVNGFYWSLKRHECFMENSGTRSSGRATFSKLIRQWRTYAVLLSAALIFGLIAMFIDTFYQNPDATSNDINYTTQGVESIPKPHAIASPMVTLAFYVLGAWRAWNVKTDSSPSDSKDCDGGQRRRTSVSLRNHGANGGGGGGGGHRRNPTSEMVNQLVVRGAMSRTYDSLTAGSPRLSPRPGPSNGLGLEDGPNDGLVIEVDGSANDDGRSVTFDSSAIHGEKIDEHDTYTFNVEYEPSETGSEIRTPARTVLVASLSTEHPRYTHSRTRSHSRDNSMSNYSHASYASSVPSRDSDSTRAHATMTHIFDANHGGVVEPSAAPGAPPEAFGAFNVMHPEKIRSSMDPENSYNPSHLASPMRTLPRLPDEAPARLKVGGTHSSREKIKTEGFSKNLTVPPRARNTPRRVDLKSNSLSHQHQSRPRRRSQSHGEVPAPPPAPENPESSPNSFSSSSSSGGAPPAVASSRKPNMPWEREREHERERGAPSQQHRHDGRPTSSSDSVRHPKKTFAKRVGSPPAGSPPAFNSTSTRVPEHYDSRYSSNSNSRHHSSAQAPMVSPERDSLSRKSSSATAHRQRNSIPAISHSQHKKPFSIKAHPPAAPLSSPPDHLPHARQNAPKSRNPNPFKSTTSSSPRHQPRSPPASASPRTFAMDVSESHPGEQDRRRSRPPVSSNLPRKAQAKPAAPSHSKRAFVIRAVNPDDQRPPANSHGPRHKPAAAGNQRSKTESRGHKKSQSATPHDRPRSNSAAAHAHSHSDGAVAPKGSSGANSMKRNANFLADVPEHHPPAAAVDGGGLGRSPRLSSFAAPRSKPALGHEQKSVFTRSPKPSPGAPRTIRLPQSQESLLHIQSLLAASVKK